MTKPVWEMSQIVPALSAMNAKWYFTPVRFSFYESMPGHLSPAPPNFQPLTLAQREAVRGGFELVADVANISFTEVPDAAGAQPWIRFQTIWVNAEFSGSADPRWNDSSSPYSMIGVDVTFNRRLIDQRGDYLIGDWNRMIVLHEILHAIGMSHPGPYNGPGYNYEDHALYVQDTNQYTVMSYWTADKSGADHEVGGKLYRSATPLLHDIAALHAIYGANMTTRTGDTVYGFNSTAGRAVYDILQNPHPIFAIWDAGGIDTLDLSGFATGSRIDLQPGAFSDAGGMTANISIAFGATIENAVGGPGNDSIAGNAAQNLLQGGAGDDLLDGRGGADVLVGGPGNDSFVVDDPGDLVVEAADGGFDDVRTAFAAYSLGGHVNIEGLTGTSDAGQALTGDGGANLIRGGGGNDVIDGGGGSDVMRGGRGDDLYAVDAPGDTVEEEADAGFDEVRTGLAAYALGAHVELLVPTSEIAHDFRGSATSNAVFGAGGNDILRMQDGGGDRAEGRGGNDVLFFGGAFDEFDRPDGGEGVDTLVLQGDYPSLVMIAASLIGIEGISLQSGSITRWGQSGANSYDYRLAVADANTPPASQLRVNAQSLLAGEDLVFNGAAESDGGQFVIYAGFGTDVLTGGAGNDVFFFEAGRLGAGDRIDGGGGNDAVVVSGAPADSAMLSATIASGMLTAIESLSLNGRFASDPAARPSYALTIENGNIAPGGRLIVNGSSLAGTQTMAVDGSATIDASFALFGGAWGDALTGGTLGDLIYAGGGSDALRGGPGWDLFQYRSAADSAPGLADRIYDFEQGSDKIDLALIDANPAADGDQAFAFFAGGSFSGAPGELRALFDPGAGMWTVYGDLDGDGNAEFLLEVIVPAGQPLAASDFIL